MPSAERKCTASGGGFFFCSCAAKTERNSQKTVAASAPTDPQVLVLRGHGASSACEMIHNTRRERAALWPRIRSSSEVLWHLWRQTSLRNLRFLIRKWHFLSNCIVVSDKTLRKKLCMGTYMFCGHLKWIFEGQELTYTHTRLNRNTNVGKINERKQSIPEKL